MTTKYLQTYRRAARVYAAKALKKRSFTKRVGEEGGFVISARTQVAYNILTDTETISCALWHRATLTFKEQMHYRT